MAYTFRTAEITCQTGSILNEEPSMLSLKPKPKPIPPDGLNGDDPTED